MFNVKLRCSVGLVFIRSIFYSALPVWESSPVRVCCPNFEILMKHNLSSKPKRTQNFLVLIHYSLPVNVGMFHGVHSHHWFPWNLFFEILLQIGLFRMILVRCFVERLRKIYVHISHFFSSCEK